MQEVFRKSYIDCLNTEKRKNSTCWAVLAWISFSVLLAKNKGYPIGCPLFLCHKFNKNNKKQVELFQPAFCMFDYYSII